MRQSLMDACGRLLAQYPPSAISTEMLLQEADVSRGTLYNHFPSASELLQSTLVQVVTRQSAQNIALLKQAVSQSNTFEEFVAALRYITEVSQSPSRRLDRLNRIRLIAHSEGIPVLAKALTQEQDRLTEALIWVVNTGKRRGWVRKDLPAHPVAVLIQAYTTGRIVDDVASKKMRPKEWTALIGTLIIDGIVTHDTGETAKP